MNSNLYKFVEFCESNSFSLVKPNVKKQKKKNVIKKKVNPEFTEELARAEDYMNDPSYNKTQSNIYDL
jgi:hypothetical protein